MPRKSPATDQLYVYILACLTTILITSLIYYYSSYSFVLYYLGKRAAKADQHEMAIDYFNDSLKNTRDNPKLLLKLAKVFENYHELNRAIEIYQRIIKNYRSQDQLHTIKKLANLYDRQNKLKQAALILAHYRHDLDDDMIVYMATLYFRINRCIKVVQLLRPMSVQPNLGPERKLKIAKVLNWCNQKDDTFNILHRLKKQYPAFIPARIYLARIHTWNRDFLSAQIEYENILKHSPNRHRLRTELVNVLYWQHKYMEAQKELLTIPSEKRSQEINTLLGELYMVNHDFAAAEELYRNKLHADPDNHSVRVKLAQVLSWNNKLNEAIAEYKILVNNLPHDRQLRRHYAMVLSWANQPIEAARQLKLTL